MSPAATNESPSVASGADALVWFNPYSLHYDLLRHQVLDAASASLEDLEGAGIELTEGWLQEIDPYPNDCHTYVTQFEHLKRLHLLGSLSVYDHDSIVTKIRRCDVFFALALQDNEAAHYLFSAKANTGWDPDDAVRYGLDAALSAANAYMFGLLLKTRNSRPNHCGWSVSSHE